MHLNRFKKFLTQKLQKLYVTCFWVRIDQRVGFELIGHGCEMSEPGYESSGYERSMGTKQLDTILTILPARGTACV